MHPAPGDDHRALGVADRFGEAGKLGRVGAQAALAPDLRFEERGREVVGLGLDVLRERKERRPACRRVEHDRQGLWQRLHYLLGATDPIPVAGDRLEGISCGDGWVTEMLHLLQHRVNDAVLEGVA